MGGRKALAFYIRFFRKLTFARALYRTVPWGGAGFFALKPKNALLADLNPDLINAYSVVRDNPRELRIALEEHQSRHSDDHYYAVRASKPDDALGRGARFLYLNRACWNGLYRVNQLGNFNVPKGTKTSIILETDDFDSAAEALASAEIEVGDFESFIDRAQHGDLVFADPPYTVMHNMNGFLKYNENIFSWKDQIRLRDSVVRAASRGVHVVMTNADHESLKSLYADVSTIRSIQRASVISGLNKGRSHVTEMLVML